MRVKELIKRLNELNPEGDLEVIYTYDSIYGHIIEVTNEDEYDWLPAPDPENHTNGKSLQQTGNKIIILE